MEDSNNAIRVAKTGKLKRRKTKEIKTLIDIFQRMLLIKYLAVIKSIFLLLLQPIKLKNLQSHCHFIKKIEYKGSNIENDVGI